MTLRQTLLATSANIHGWGNIRYGIIAEQDRSKLHWHHADDDR